VVRGRAVDQGSVGITENGGTAGKIQIHDRSQRSWMGRGVSVLEGGAYTLCDPGPDSEERGRMGGRAGRRGGESLPKRRGEQYWAERTCVRNTWSRFVSGRPFPDKAQW